MPGRLTRVESCLVKIETTEGVDSTPATGNAVRCAGPVGIEEGAEFQNPRDDTISETIDRLGPLAPAGKYVQLTIPVHLRGFGSAYSASNLPEVDALLRSCALSQTVVTTGGSESVTYDFRSTGQESCTIYLYHDGLLNKVLGCRGTVQFAGPAGQPLTATFTMRGLMQTVTDTGVVAGTYQATTPPLVRGASTLVYNAVATLVCRSLGLDLGGTVSPRGSVNATDALAGYHITSRKTMANFVCEGPLVGTADLRGDRDAATARVLDYTVAPASSPQYNRIKVHMDKFTPTQVGVADQDEFEVNNVQGIVSIEGSEDCAIIFD